MSSGALSGLAAPPPVPFVLDSELEGFVVHDLRARVWRIHGHNNEDDTPFAPVYFSRAAHSRWDFAGDPNEKHGAGTLCVGLSFTSALAEYFSADWPSVLLKATSRRVLTHEQVTRRYATTLRLPDSLALFDLTAPGALSCVGADALLTATKDYAATRAWGAWFYACGEIDGLIYSSRPGGAQARNLVLFNRPGIHELLEDSAGRSRPLIRWPQQMAGALKQLKVEVLPKPRAPVD